MSHSDQSFQGIPALPCNIAGTGPETQKTNIQMLDFDERGNWVTLSLMFLFILLYFVIPQLIL